MFANEIPEKVREGLKKYAAQHNVPVEDLEKDLLKDHIMGNYYFIRNGMYHGVELNGYVHT